MEKMLVSEFSLFRCKLRLNVDVHSVGNVFEKLIPKYELQLYSLIPTTNVLTYRKTSAAFK